MLLDSIPLCMRHKSVEPKPKDGEVAVQKRQARRSDPLQAPSKLAASNAILPDAVDRIMKMAEARRSHGIALERRVEIHAFCGKILGFGIGVIGLALATYAAVTGQPWFGAEIGGTIVVLVRALVYSKPDSKKKEKRARRSARDDPAQRRRPAGQKPSNGRLGVRCL